MHDRQFLLFVQTIDERFEEYHARNPLVFKLFEKFAREIWMAGHSRYSAKAIIERVRWEVYVKTKEESFKINNNFTSRYARLLVKKHPEFEGFFEMRELRAA